jgi:hypothetical protein
LLHTSLKLCHEQWLALIALRRTMLHEHHDYFLASQHLPTLRLVLGLLIIDLYAFLLDHNKTCIGLHRYVHVDTWVECLNDLARYCMAIEDEELHDQEVCTRQFCSSIAPTPASDVQHDHLHLVKTLNSSL